MWHNVLLVYFISSFPADTIVTNLGQINLVSFNMQVSYFFQSGVQTNSINSILYQESDDVDGMNQINIINHSSYYDVDTFSALADKTKGCFTVLSTNIQSVNSKFSEFELFIAELKLINFKFSIICMQECWISENDDLSQIQVEGYTYLKVKGVVQVVV